ncbi:DEAD/DEAH box helicase [Haloimpatiens lingqiaonensis]|uniref:DEAD/DEAH box helicase n=1 Tax=Haloimpatiens lingqiaonensis TaxID=1380675 RepID=UPI0010FDA11E|nr:DEAD/DEAH box helicase [Haloimpatiens lingqiaonensis]
MSEFKNFHLSNDILKAIEKLGYINPSPVQEKVIPFVLENRDIIVKSQTGSGKTAAFSIPICNEIEIEETNPQVLVLTPTRELAVQIKEEISNIGRFKRIRCAAIYGKQPMEVQKRELKQRVHVVVGTPGRTMDHIERKTLNLEKVKYLVIDEADEMLNMGFIDQVESIIKVVPKKRVTMLFSATMSEKIEDLCDRYIRNAEKIDINPEAITVKKINEECYEMAENEKLNILNNIIYTKRPDKCILFCNTRDKVDELVKNMKKQGFCTRGLHGGMEQKDRLEVIESYKRDEIQFLVATDVAARGIHIEDVTHVINYDVPVEKENYVHRIGRTGRAGNEGTAITFVSPYNKRLLEEIEQYLGYMIPKKEIPSHEEVKKGEQIFKDSLKNKPKAKAIKKTKINEEITKIYINAGKKKKIRPGDIVGSMLKIEGIDVEDIGIIDIQDGFSYVDILGGKGKNVLKAAENMKIKGKSVRIQKAVK